MKSRNKEVNIFNMSLLDILSGALGAFCFLMLVLFPYYKPNQQQQEQQKQPPPQNYEEAMKRLQALQQQLQQCQAERADCQAQMKQATERIGELYMRNPITVTAAFDGPNDFDLYVEDDRVSDSGKGIAKVDGKVKQGPFWNGDHHVDFAAGFATEVWTMRDVPTGEYRVYYKLFKSTPDRKPTDVVGTIVTSLDPFIVLPDVTLTDEGQVVRVATITTAADGHAKIHVDVPSARQ